MWLSSEPSSRWTVSFHKNWGENVSNKSILQVLNQNIVAYEKGFWKSIIVPQINGGESVPVWWESLSNKMNIFLQCDFDHPLIQNFYQKVDEGYIILLLKIQNSKNGMKRRSYLFVENSFCVFLPILQYLIKCSRKKKTLLEKGMSIIISRKLHCYLKS